MGNYNYIYDYDIRDVRTIAYQISPAFVENGFGSKEEYATFTQKFPRIKMPSYAQLSKEPVVGSRRDPGETYALLKSLFGPLPNWRAGTDRCAKYVIFNPAWESENYAWYGSPIWYETVAHEMAHVYQGCGYVGDNVQIEWTADLIGLEVLASIIDDDAQPVFEQALMAALREAAIGSVLRRLYSEGGDPQDFLDGLELSTGERRYYQDEINRCEISESFCMKRSAQYFEGPLYRLLKSHDDTIYYAANQSGVIVIDDLMVLIDKWFGNGNGASQCYMKYCVE